MLRETMIRRGARNVYALPHEASARVSMIFAVFSEHGRLAADKVAAYGGKSENEIITCERERLFCIMA